MRPRRTTAESTLEDWPPDGSLQRTSPSVEVRTRTKTVFSGSVESLTLVRPCTRGRKRRRAPIIFKRPGRTNCSKATIDETGLPGRPNSGLPADLAEGKGLGRLHRHLPELDVAELTKDLLDEVVLTHRDPARRHDHVGLVDAAGDRVAQRRGIVGNPPEVDHLDSEFGEHGRQHRPVGVANLTGSQGGAVDRNEFVTGRGQSHPGTAMDRHLGDPEIGEDSDVGRSESDSLVDHLGAGLDIAPGWTHRGSAAEHRP